jgi:glycosyltransferase involved in cell wall biosynthesis
MVAFAIGRCSRVWASARQQLGAITIASRAAQGTDVPAAVLNIAMVAACPYPARRGTPIRIQRLAEAMAARGHRVHVVTYHYGGAEMASSVSVHRIPALGSYRNPSPGPTYVKLALLDPLLTIKLWQVLHRYPVDIIHAHHFESLLVAAAARLRARTPLIFDAHTLLASELPFYHLGLPLRVKRGIASLFDRRLPRVADHVITVTERIRLRLLQLGVVREEGVSVVPNGVESQFFYPEANGRAKHSNGGPILIFTGNLAPYQGIDLMLLALRKVLNRRSDVRLQIVTDSSFERYDALARELGILGSIEVVRARFEEIPRLLAGATIAVNPRIDCDGMPVKLLNYMAAGKPVLSFEGSAPGVRHRQTGWLVADGDVDGFAEGALTLLGNAELASALGQNARRLVENQHDWERSADLTESVYHRVLRERARRE